MPCSSFSKRPGTPPNDINRRRVSLDENRKELETLDENRSYKELFPAPHRDVFVV